MLGVGVGGVEGWEADSLPSFTRKLNSLLPPILSAGAFRGGRDCSNNLFNLVLNANLVILFLGINPFIYSFTSQISIVRDIVSSDLHCLKYKVTRYQLASRLSSL